MVRKAFAFFLAAAACFSGIATARGDYRTVTSRFDDGPGSLRQVVAEAAADDTIVFNVPLQDPEDRERVLFIGSEIVIDKRLIIVGSGSAIVLSGPLAPGSPKNTRIFRITASGRLSLRGITLRGGAKRGPGGAILNDGTLRIDEATLSSSTATTFGSAIGHGGAIYNRGTLELRNVTVVGNHADANGGAVCNDGGSVRITHSTIAQNTAANGGGLYGAANVGNTIVATNTAATSPDVSGTFTSRGFNIVGTGTGAVFFADIGDQIGVTAAQLKLSPMRDHGGDTMTMLPHKTSVAVDRGFNFPDDGGYTIPFDQRGRGRPYNDPNVPDALTGDSTDVGAVELGPPQTSSTRTVTTVSGHDDDSCTIDDCTFAEAVDAANAAPDADTIVFDQALTGGIRIDPALTDGLVISSPVTIRVNSLNTLFINPGYQRAFTVTGGPVRMENLAIRWAAPPKDGAIYNSGDLTMVDCQVTGASLGFGSRGAGAFNAAGGKLVLQNCTFAYNKAYGEGGAIYNDGGLLNATNCTFSDNVADRGAGIFNAAAATGRISLLNCTLSGNHADGGEPLGNGVYNASGSDAVHVANTIIATDNSFYPDVVGPVVSKGHNLIGNGQSSTGFINGLNGDQVGTSNFPKWPSLNPLAKNGGQTLTRALRDDSLAINAGNVALAPYTDQRGYQRSEKTDVGAFEWQPPDIPPSPTPTPPPGTTPTPPPSPPPSPTVTSTPTPTPTGSPSPTAAPADPHFGNMATRLRVGSGENVLIGGFILTGSGPKKLMVRGIGPSLTANERLANPLLELYDADGRLVQTNDDWRNATNRQEIGDSNLAPRNDLEPAILLELMPGAYTAVVRDEAGGEGLAVVEFYDLSGASGSRLANLSTRGDVQLGDNVLIGGLIVMGSAPQRAIVRAIGPSLPITGKLLNPALSLYDMNGEVIQTNDDWRSHQEDELKATTIPPGDDREAAIVRTFGPGAYTAIVHGVNQTTGVAVVEVYALQ